MLGWLMVVLMVSFIVILMVKVPILRNGAYQPRTRTMALGTAMAGFTPLVGQISQRYLTGTAHYLGVALQGAMIGLALVLIWKGRREMRSDL